MAAIKLTRTLLVFNAASSLRLPIKHTDKLRRKSRPVAALAGACFSLTHITLPLLYGKSQTMSKCAAEKEGKPWKYFDQY